MTQSSVRERIEAYARERFGVEAEQLPFNHEDYAVLRHQDSGKWFAVLFAKPRDVLGLDGGGDAEVMSVKVPERGLADMLLQQPGYLRGYPAASWHWVSAVLDGTVPIEDLLSWLEDSYHATARGANKRTPLPKRSHKPNDLSP